MARVAPTFGAARDIGLSNTPKTTVGSESIAQDVSASSYGVTAAIAAIL